MIQHGTIVLVHVEVAVKDKAGQISSVKALPPPTSEAASEGLGVAVDGPGATTGPGQSENLSGSDSNSLASRSAGAHTSEHSISNDPGSTSFGTSSSKYKFGSKEEASDTGEVAVDGQKEVQGSSGGAGGESQTQPQRMDGESDGAGNSAGGGQGGNEDADQGSQDKGKHDAEKDTKTTEGFVVHVESTMVRFEDDSAHQGHCQVGRSLEWSSM
jgi:hypothetical protein